MKEGGIISKFIDIDFAKAGKEKQGRDQILSKLHLKLYRIVLVANENHDLVSYETLGLNNVQVNILSLF